MALVGHLHKIVFGGSLGTVDSWSCGIHFISPDAGDVPFSPAVTDAIKNWYSSGDSWINSAARLEYLKINEVSPTTGLYLDSAGARTFFYDPVVATALHGVGDPAATVAITWTTAATRGFAHAGRIFPPSKVLDIDLAADGRIKFDSAQFYAAQAAALISDLNSAALGECYVWSQRGQVQRAILGCRVGLVIDHQLRRRKQLSEKVYATALNP